MYNLGFRFESDSNDQAKPNQLIKVERSQSINRSKRKKEVLKDLKFGVCVI